MEEAEGLESGAAGAEAAGASGVDPVAIALALSGASRERADAFLDSQNALIADQRHHVHEQTKLTRLQAEELSHELSLRHWSLWVRHSSGLLKLGLELSAGLLLLLVVAGISLMVWNAAHADGLVIESFSVPPDLAARGLTGQVVAGELLDRLTELNQATISSRTAKSYAASWGDDIKVEIPETGVSVAEAYRFLRRWLGHESHISGAVWHSQGGIVITARSEGKSVTVSGPDPDIGGPIQKAAEAVFSLAEPYRYGAYLRTRGRYAEAIATFRQQATKGSAVDQAWGLLGLASTQAANGDIGPREVGSLNRQAVELDPSNVFALNNFAGSEQALSQLEGAARDSRKLAELLSRDDVREVNDSTLPVQQEMTTNELRELMGAYGESASSIANLLRSRETGSRVNLSTRLTLQEINAHDLKAARVTPRERDRKFQSAGSFAYGGLRIKVAIAVAEQDWPAVLAAASSAEPLLKVRSVQEPFLANVAPVQAYAEARLGRFREAEALIATTPGDCDECMLMRARIAELEGQHARADWRFDRAVHHAPSIPLMYSTWGQALLERGQPDAAIAKFTLANQKGPHFADPLEGWGEALMAENQSHLALAKFAEAEKYAPNWGRLHMKWGEALVYAGKRDEAKAQFARAGQLDLTPTDKAELAQEKT